MMGQELTMKGSGVVATDGSTGTLTMSIPSVGEMQEIITPDGYYIDMGTLLGSELPDGKRWLFMSYDDLAGESGVDLREPQQQNEQTSTQSLEYLQATTGDVEKVGEDTVAGRPATHYLTHLDYAKFAEEHMPDATAEQREQMAELGVVPIDVWINGDDEVVKMSFDMDASSFGARGATMRMTMEITAFGEPIDVQAPPADEVITQDELEALQGSSAV
jgi:hypothetical protein